MSHVGSAMETSRDALLIVLRPEEQPIVLRVGRKHLEPKLELGGELFTEITTDDFFGFYDWLRPEGGQIIGVHIHLDDCEGRDLGIDTLAGVEVISPLEWQGAKDLRIWFGERKEFDEKLSCDQDFGDNGIYHGSRGSVALVFNAP